MTNAPLILIVDDSTHNIQVLEKMLKAQGYDIITAASGEQALERIAETPPDLVVLDVVMPEMDGFDVARAMRADAASRFIPIIMLTVLRELEDKLKGLEAGADDFVSKPFNSVELLARVRSLLRIKQLHDELQVRNALLERLLTRYVSTDVARDILLNPAQDLRLDGQSCEVSVLFANIRGFTRFSEQHSPAQVTQTLNYIFHHLAAIILEHNGTLDKYLGDAIMAFYGAPVPSAEHAAQALRTAWAMQRRFAQLSREDARLRELGLGIGISTGQAVVGTVGSENMLDYTVLGHTPNTAYQLQKRAQAGQTLVSEYTYQAVQDIVVANSIETLPLDEGAGLAQVYQIIAVEEPETV